MEQEELKILYVDQDLKTRSMAPSFLGMAIKVPGFVVSNVSVAKNSREAIDLIDTAEKNGLPFNFVVSEVECDAATPGRKSGFDVIGHAKKAMPNCIAFAITKMNLDESLRTEGFSAGADFCFQRPVGFGDLSVGLESLLNGKERNF